MIWIKRGGFAVLDQGLFSGANFLANILLARWLSVEEYGVFTLAFSMLLLLAAFHTAILTEPMLVFGASRYAGRFNVYLGLLLYGHFAVVFVIALIIGAVALVFWQLSSLQLARSLTGLAIVSPFLLLTWLARRAFYVILKSQWAAAGSAVYLIITVAGIYALDRLDRLTSSSTLAVMGVAGLVASFMLLLILKPKWKLNGSKQTVKEILADHWRYGRWAVGSSVLSSSYSTVNYIVITAYLSLGGVATLKAVYNLVAPAYRVFVTLTLLLVPWSAGRVRKNGSGFLTKDAMRISISMGATAALYFLLMVMAGPTIMDLLYAGKYSEYAWLIPYIALMQLFASLGGGVHVVLRATGRSDLVFTVYLISCCLSILGNLALVSLFGFGGAAVGVSLFPLLGTITAWWLWLSRGRRDSGDRIRNRQ
jgi:O-antigen/teichoic acid export membrane protein